jgi:hypothetical protein
MRKTLTTAALLLALSCTALGGEIQIPPIAPPDSPQANTPQEPTTNGWIQSESADSLTQIALDLLAALPSLF